MLQLASGENVASAKKKKNNQTDNRQTDGRETLGQKGIYQSIMAGRQMDIPNQQVTCMCGELCQKKKRSADCGYCIFKDN